MRVANVDGLVMLFYDGSRELYNYELEQEWWHQLHIGYKKTMNGWEEWEMSDECKQYWRERLSWQQVIVVEGVTKIPNRTFQYCLNIQKVIFANTVVRIEDYAFFDCDSLVYIKLPINLEYIGELAFQLCNLSSVFISPRCREVRDYAFACNTNLKIVHVPQNVELQFCIFYETKLLAESPFGDEEGYYNCSQEEVWEYFCIGINHFVDIASQQVNLNSVVRIKPQVISDCGSDFTGIFFNTFLSAICVYLKLECYGRAIEIKLSEPLCELNWQLNLVIISIHDILNFYFEFFSCNELLI